MTNMADLNDLHRDVSNFLDVYRIMPSPTRAAFEAQLDQTIYSSDDKTKILFQTLKQAAKDTLTAEEAIEKMKKAVAHFPIEVSPG